MTDVVIVGSGPAGLAAADKLSAAGHKVMILDRMASPARKFLLAGRGGLNLTHSEDIGIFLERYGSGRSFLEPLIRRFDPQALRRFAEDLGQETFVGSSGRVFPKAMKASPLLRAWLARLEKQGVTFRLRQTWEGQDAEGRNLFRAQDGSLEALPARATLLALGGGSWPRLGSRGDWLSVLEGWGVDVAPLRPSNCGFLCGWSPFFAERFAGQGKREAVAAALAASIPSIIVSAMGLFAATFGVALYSDIDIISSMCMLMARGAIISMLCVVFILPAAFMLLDRVIGATSIGFRPVKKAD